VRSGSNVVFLFEFFSSIIFINLFVYVAPASIPNLIIQMLHN